MLLINKESCSVRRVAKSGDGPFSNVKVSENGVEATDGYMAARVDIPVYDTPHPLSNGFGGPKLIPKKDIEIIEKLLPTSAEYEKDPRSAAVITIDGARIHDDRTVDFKVEEESQQSLPINDITFPSFANLLPKPGTARATTRMSVKRLEKLVAVAKSAGVEILDLSFPLQGDGPICLTGQNKFAQRFTGVMNSLVNGEEDSDQASLFGK